MKYDIIISERAYKSLFQSIEWYNEQSKGLGKRFYSKIDKTIKVISKNPYAFEIKFDFFRGATVDVFPYIIMYFIQEPDKIVIANIFHTSRKPE